MRATKAETIPNPFLEDLNAFPRVADVAKRYNALSLFAGGGGLDLGVQLAGFDVRFSSDIEPQLCETLEYNFPEAHIEPVDVQKLKKRDIVSLTGEKDFDLLIGGPPCQSFSILGQRKSFGDPRGQLVYDYVRLVKEVKPRAFIFENVSGFLTVNKGNDWKEFLDYVALETGYSIKYAVVNAADYGVPQIRKRVIIVGVRNKKSRFDFPLTTHYGGRDKLNLLNASLPKWRPAIWAFENIEGLPNHDIRIHGDRVTRRYSMIAPGSRDRVDHTDRIHPDFPSGTVLVGSKGGGGRPFIHPIVPRHISVREAARLQSFPDWYVFRNTGTWQYRGVGNAVPPMLAHKIASALATALDA